MTLVEIRNQLITQFLKSDTLSLKYLTSKIKVSKNQEKIKENLIKSVLDDMVEDGFCNRINGAEDDFVYVSSVPFGTHGQNVNISYSTAEIIATILEQYAASRKIDDLTVNKLELKESDLLNLCIVCAQLLESQDLDDSEQIA